MSEQEKSVTGIRRFLNLNVFGGLLLLAATAMSMYQVMNTQKQLFDPDTTVVRIAHWQLELGYSNSLQSVIDDYEKLWAAKGKKVKILQMPVTEKVYPQWLNTHMIAGDAPDISEMGMSGMLNNVSYTARYYLPLTTLVNGPNPYNKGTTLENIAWRETFIDGMRGAYNTNLQDYYGVPTAFFTTRLFVNLDVLKAATGSDQTPKTFGQLIDVCEKIRQYSKQQQAASGHMIVPIAGSKYSSAIFIDRYLYPFTSWFEQELDLDLDGLISDQEAYIGFATGKVSFDDPRLKAFFECMRDLSRNFSSGFYSMERQDAAFAFVQGKAAMIATGSWDAASLFEQADYKIGLFDFPIPAPGEKYGQYVRGRGNEATASAGGQFGIYKFSRNVDQAIDFLQYLTSQGPNQKMMQQAEWIPAVIGTRPSQRMAPFAADPTGYAAKMNIYYGSVIQGLFNGKMQTYLEGQESYDSLKTAISTALLDVKIGGDRAWYLEWDDACMQLRSQERVMAVQTVRGMMQNQPDAELKHRQLLLQQVRANDCENQRHRFEQTRGKPLQDPTKVQ